MSTVSRNKPKAKGIKRLLNSFDYALDGLVYAFKNEQNLVVHIIATMLVIIFGLILRLSSTEWLIVLLVIGLVIATELINTSIEAVVDLISPKKHPLAKIAKDTAAAAVFVFAFIAVLIGIAIFVPKLVVLLA